jgi:hypothetical protein
MEPGLVLRAGLGPFPLPEPQAAAVKGAHTLPDRTLDKGPEQLFQFAEIKVRAQGLDGVGHLFVDVKCVVARIDEQAGGIGAQGIEVAAPQASHLGIVIRFPNGVTGPAPYEMHGHIHETADPPCSAGHLSFTVPFFKKNFLPKYPVISFEQP